MNSEQPGSGTAATGERWRASKRTCAEKLGGKVIIVLTIISFVFVGLILNLLQLVLTISIRLSKADGWRRAHKRLNGHLLYAIFAQPIFMLYFWSRAKVNVLLAERRLLDDVDKQIFGIVIANHTFELDWMACFVLADQLGNMGAYKCFSKAELKFLPIVGWAFWMSDLIYVQRHWKHDRLLIEGQLDELLIYDQILLGLFAEGTRWTPEKHAAALQFAESRQLKPYKHHLFPRPRGFNYTLRHYLRREQLEPASMRGKKLRLINLQIAMPDRPEFGHFLDGRQIVADVYCEEVELSAELRREALESRDEDECPLMTQLLRDIYTRKDQLLDEYERNGHRFIAPDPDRAGLYPVRKPLKAGLFWLAGMLLTYGSLIYLALSSGARLARSPTFWGCVGALLAGGILLLRRIERESRPRNWSKTGTRPAASAGAMKTKLT